MKEFGSYIMLNTLAIDNKHTSMSAPQFAKLLEITHEIAPIYELKEKNCYWFALLNTYLLGCQENNWGYGERWR